MKNSSDVQWAFDSLDWLIIHDNNLIEFTVIIN